jgi:hypothetical protein
LITRKLADALPNAGVLTLSLLALSLWLALAMQVKRWHDRGKSGWMILIHLIPIVGTVWSMAELGFFPGTIGANRYGEDPLQPEDNCTEQAGFRLLAQATRLEGSGRGQEALVAYKDIADRYAHTAAGQDARKSAESLVLSTGIPTLSGNADHVSVVLPQTTVAGLTLSGMPWTQPPPLMPVPDRFVRPKISRLAVASFVLPLSALVVPPLIIVPLFRLGLGEVKATVVATVLAGWLMVSSGVWVAGIFLGHSALRRIKRSSRALKGSGWAIASLTLSYLLVSSILVLILTHTKERNADSSDSDTAARPEKLALDFYEAAHQSGERLAGPFILNSTARQ